MTSLKIGYSKYFFAKSAYVNVYKKNDVLTLQLRYFNIQFLKYLKYMFISTI